MWHAYTYNVYNIYIYIILNNRLLVILSYIGCDIENICLQLINNKQTTRFKYFHVNFEKDGFRKMCSCIIIYLYQWVLRMVRFNVGITNLYIRNGVGLSWTNESQKTNGQRVTYKSSYVLTGICFFSCVGRYS